MPRSIVLRCRNAFALDCMANDNARAVSGRENRFIENLAQFADVVTVALVDLEAKARPLVSQRLHILNLENAAGRLDLVVIDNRGEMTELMLVRTSGGLPHRSFVDLSITHQ